MKLHKWHKEISAFTRGEQVQFKDDRYSEDWQDIETEDIDYFDFRFFNSKNREFRIKPRIIIAYTKAWIKNSGAINCFKTNIDELEFCQYKNHNLKLSFEGGTNKLINAEVI